MYKLTAEDARACGNNALIFAARNGCIELLKCLHETFGLTVEDVRDYNNYALRSSAPFGHVEVLKLYMTLIS